MSPTYYFEEVKRPISKRGKCPECGKTTVRSRVFSQTINPFNKNDAGELKTAAEIREELRESGAAWTPDFRHQACEGDTDA